MEVKSELLITQRLHLFENEYAQNLFGRQTGTALGRILEVANQVIMDEIKDLRDLIEVVADGLKLSSVLMGNWGWHKGTLFVYLLSHRSVLSFALQSVF